jgi:hypothetical protein
MSKIIGATVGTTQNISNKADKPANWKHGNFVQFDSEGNLRDSGYSSSSFLPSSAVSVLISPHTGNKDIHVTAEDKARWDAGSDIDAIVSSVIAALPKYNGEVTAV